MGYFNYLNSEERILSAPIINLENLEPSYEELESDTNANIDKFSPIKERQLKNNKNKLSLKLKKNKWLLNKEKYYS